MTESTHVEQVHRQDDSPKNPRHLDGKLPQVFAISVDINTHGTIHSREETCLRPASDKLERAAMMQRTNNVLNAEFKGQNAVQKHEVNVLVLVEEGPSLRGRNSSNVTWIPTSALLHSILQPFKKSYQRWSRASPKKKKK